MHYAIHGHTAAEHILERADHQKQNMGLMTWQDAPDGKIKKSDVIIAKNYLSEFELSQLNRMVTSYLDFAENMAQRKIPLTMQDRETRLNGFIEMFEYGLLKDAGKVTAAIDEQSIALTRTPAAAGSAPPSPEGSVSLSM